MELDDQDKAYSESATSELFYAIELNDSEKVHLALKGKADPNFIKSHYSPLLLCLLRKCHRETVALLLDYGAKVDRQNDFGVSPLLDAVRKDDFASFTLFVTSQSLIDYRQRTNQGDDVIMMAVKYTVDVAYLEILEQQIGSLYSVDGEGNTPCDFISNASPRYRYFVAYDANCQQ